MTTTVGDSSRIHASDEEMAFINRILESPEDDAPRLIFADWLEENGWITEFDHNSNSTYWIRSQCLRLSCGRRNYDYILSVNNAEVETGWRYGFREVVICTAEWWLDNAAELTKFHPIRQVTLTTHPEIDYIDSDMCIAYLPCYTKNLFGFDVEEMGKRFLEKRGFEPEWIADLLLFEYWPNIAFKLPGEK